jgi:hypothetical protein
MLALRTTLLAAILVLLISTSIPGQVQFQVIQGEALENFLRNAEIVAAKTTPIGLTLPKKVTLTLNGQTRFGIFKDVDIYKDLMKFEDGRIDQNHQDTWKAEIAAYEIDKIIGLGMVPATVERTYKGTKGSLQIWVDSIMSEADHKKNKVRIGNQDLFNQMMYKARLFDNLVYNTDRNLQNLLITKDWEIILIDHSRAFRPPYQLKSAKDLEMLSIAVLEGIKRLNEKNLTEKTGKYLTKPLIDGILKRRDAILSLAAKQATQKGEAATYLP